MSASDQTNGRVWAISALLIDLMQREARNHADPEAWIRERFGAIPVPAAHAPPDAIEAFVSHLAEMQRISLMGIDGSTPETPMACAPGVH